MARAHLFVVASAATLVLSGCSETAEPLKEQPVAEKAESETEAQQQASTEPASPLDLPLPEIISTEINDLKLGAKIEGPVGTEVQASLATDLGALGDIESYVACPDGMDVCDPKTAPAGTIYTYVHTITPGADEPNDLPFPQPEAVLDVKSATKFHIKGPVYGFNGVAGYSFADGRKALGADMFISVQCKEGSLGYTVELGDAWSNGETISFFWQSTIAPKGPGEGFTLYADGKEGTGSGPVPGKPLSDVEGAALNNLAQCS